MDNIIKSIRAFETFCSDAKYTPKTTIWQDFSIAEAFGEDAIRDTYERIFNEWKDNVYYLTELVLVTNWKSWYYQDNESLCKLYSDLWQKCDGYACDNLKGKDAKYFFRTTD